MNVIRIGTQDYHVDPLGFLVDWREWDEAFASGTAADVGIPGGLTVRHWEVIRFIRDHFVESGRCPVVYQACRRFGLRLKQLRELFPAGYQRGACKLAGLSYGVEPYRGDARWTEEMGELAAMRTKAYPVDAHGFLLDPAEWDERWASGKAEELGMDVPLGDDHWRVLRWLRVEHQSNGAIPTMYATCESFGIELEELERLFPTGYHRGAVKVAGLRLADR